jgi:diacylglycerol kinase (ATP)
MNKIKVILNPVAGRGFGLKSSKKIHTLFQESGVEFELVHTQYPLHAVRIAEEAVYEGFDVIVAAGGDGTTNEVANGLLKAAEKGYEATLGIIPLGSGSDFAFSAGVPSDYEKACLSLIDGDLKISDVGRVKLPGQKPRFFANMVGIGFDTIVTIESLKIKRLRGILMYFIVVLKTILRGFEAPVVKCVFDGKTLTLPVLMVCIANGQREGGGFLVAPQARLDDGFLDICIVPAMGRLAMLRLLPHFMKGSHVDKGGIFMSRTKHFSMTAEGALKVHADGEILCTDGSRIECQVLPNRLKIRR